MTEWSSPTSPQTYMPAVGSSYIQVTLPYYLRFTIGPSTADSERTTAKDSARHLDRCSGLLYQGSSSAFLTSKPPRPLPAQCRLTLDCSVIPSLPSAVMQIGAARDLSKPGGRADFSSISIACRQNITTLVPFTNAHTIHSDMLKQAEA